MQESHFAANVVNKPILNNVQYQPKQHPPKYGQPLLYAPQHYGRQLIHPQPIYMPPSSGYNDPLRQIKQTINQKSEVWSEIQKILAKPVYYPEDLSSTTISQRYIHSERYAPQVHMHVDKGRSKIISNYRQEYTPSPPPPRSTIQYIPYTKKYYEYQPREIIQTIYVPVEKQITEYYTIEHVTDYVLKQVDDTVVDYIPQEKFNMKIQYLPIEQHIMYVPEDTLKINNPNSVQASKVQLFQNQNTVSQVISQPIFYSQPPINMYGGLYPQGPPSPRKVQFGQPIQRTQKNIQPKQQNPNTISNISNGQISSNNIQPKITPTQNQSPNPQGFNSVAETYKVNINDSFGKQGIPPNGNSQIRKPQSANSQGFNG